MMLTLLQKIGACCASCMTYLLTLCGCGKFMERGFRLCGML
jgi:hypothetical protein